MRLFPNPQWRGSSAPPPQELSRYSLDDLNQYLYAAGMTFGNNFTMAGSKQEEIGGSFQSLAAQAYKANPIIFACMHLRQLAFSQVRFQFRRRRSGRPGELWGNEELTPLEKPWPGGTTGDLLSRMEQDCSLAGNAFVVRRSGGRLRRLRPDWVDIILGGEGSGGVDTDILGYVYWPGGRHSGLEPEMFLQEDVAHWALIPDPESQYRGMSWLQALIRDLMADKAATDHKLSFLEHGATPNLVVKLDTPDLALFEKWIAKFEEKRGSTIDRYKPLFFGAGADAKVIGADLQQIDFKAVQGAGETRIAAVARTPPVIVGLSEGLQGSSLNQGNYQAARRQFSDLWARPAWGNAAASLATVIDVPSDSELWYDDRDVSFLQEDVLDAAEIQAKEAQTIRTLLDGGCTFESIKAAVIAGDWSVLKHTELFSVQLQPPGTVAPTNGNGSVAATDEITKQVAALAKGEA